MRRVLSGVFTLVFAAAAFGADVQQALKAAARQAQGAMCVVKCTFTIAGEETTRNGIGVCIDAASGLILTTAIPQQMQAEDIKEITLIPAGKNDVHLRAKLQGMDTMTGLAFVRCEEKSDFSAVEFLSGANVSLGDLVVSAGVNAGSPNNPLTLGAGYISCEQHVPNRVLRITGGMLSLTGSVVFNTEGKGIGLVTTQPFQPFQAYQGQKGTQTLLLRNLEQTVSFTPVDEFVQVLTNIPREGVIVRPSWIGGIPVAVPESLREAKGLTGPAVMLDQILPGTPAEKAGLKDRDIVVGMNGAAITSLGSDEMTASAFRQTIARMKPGESVTLTVQSGEGPREVKLQIEAMPLMPNESAKLFQKDLGFALREKVPFDVIGADANAKRPGLLVIAVAKNTPAAQANLQEGDLVTAIDGKGAVTVSAAEKAVKDCLGQNPPRDISVTVLRGTAAETLTIKVPEK